MIESVDRNYLKLSLSLFESNKKEPKKVVTSPFLRLFYSLAPRGKLACLLIGEW